MAGGGAGRGRKKLIDALLYTLEMGSVERRIVQESYARRQPLPPRIANAPQLAIGLELYYLAYMEISTCRSVGMTAGPIPWTSVQDYATAFDFDEEQTENLHVYVRAMDKAFLDHLNAKTS